MKLDGVCKINSALGMEYQYQFGEFYIDRDYLVFDQDFSLGMKKRQTFPVAKLGRSYGVSSRRRGNHANI